MAWHCVNKYGCEPPAVCSGRSHCTAELDGDVLYSIRTESVARGVRPPELHGERGAHHRVRLGLDLERDGRVVHRARRDGEIARVEDELVRGRVPHLRAQDDRARDLLPLEVHRDVEIRVRHLHRGVVGLRGVVHERRHHRAGGVR
jgi:hypothetical protein